MKSISEWNPVWGRFKRNIPAVISLLFILTCCLAAVFAYLIAPDNTPHADLQTLEIQAKKPGYEQLFLLIPNEKQEKPHLLQRIIAGNPAAFNWVPITRYRVDGNSIAVDKFVDDDTSIVQEYDLNQITGGKPETLSDHLVTRTFWFGTDGLGRDILSRLLIGSRISLLVGLVAVFISLFVGIILGALAGYYRGRTDAIIQWLVNVSWSIPTLLLVFAITMVLGKGFWQVFVAVGLTLWVGVARLVRGQILVLRELEFVDAVRVLGFPDRRIIFRHILPNMSGPLLVIAAGNFATAIILEAGLSFLGVGVQPPSPSWGLMIKENYNFIITHNPMLALIPGVAIMLLVLAFNIAGNALRDATDVKSY